ncbi:MAG: UDP-3-O-acyl-N-acetylglucosamine deacetylase [Planctomycetota bacterium]|nr:UDP-3-O-acyl-N-acetylglucosamine deacetylase [Planctomycetota bacterium]
MTTRSQHTIARAAAVHGVGFLTGADVTLRFLPALENEGISFRRVPAKVEYTVSRQRRTAIERGGATIELVEHVMAALAGLQIDNCRVELDAPEPPGGDGSSQAFADALLRAGIVELDAPRRSVTLRHPVSCGEGNQTILGVPHAKGGLTIRYTLDYGPNSPIVPQFFEVDVTPEAFLNDIVYARTFVLEQEALALRAMGYGRRTTARDLLIFGHDGVIYNTLRAPDECARHKLLDCIGDFALAGCDLVGRVEANRSGHTHNAEFVRRLKQSHSAEFWQRPESRAA